MGSDTLTWTRVAGTPFCIRADGQMRVGVGEKLTVGIDPALASLFDAATELRI